MTITPTGRNLAPTRMLAYGLAGLPLALMGIPLYVYLPPFYANQLGLGLGAVGLALMLSRLWDVILDPIVGYYADLIPGRYRRKTLIAAGLPIFIISLAYLMQPQAGVGLSYLYFWAFLAFLGWTLISLPYLSLGAEADPTPHGRTRLSATREGAGLLGVILAAALPLILGSSEPSALLSAVFWVVALSLPLALILLFLTVPESQYRRPPIALTSGLPLLWANKPLRTLLLSFFLNNLANGIPAALFILFITDRLGAAASLGTLMLLYFGAGILALPFWTYIAHHIGKRRAWGFSVALAAISFAFVPFLHPGDTLLFGIICVITGLSLGADMALPAAIQGDLASRDANAGGGDRTGLFFGLFGLTTKLALAIAVGLGFGLLSAAGYPAGHAPNSPHDTLVLGWIYGGLPVLFKLLAAWIIFNQLTDTDSPQPTPLSTR
ncbi:MAG TPA: MFS transporter [Halothiobacillus sp.]|nr:MFS transporter [Halothiobacillus sp.]